MRKGLLDLVFDIGQGATEWLVGPKGRVPLSADTTPMVRRWGENFAAMVGYRQREVDALVAAAQQSDD